MFSQSKSPTLNNAPPCHLMIRAPIIKPDELILSHYSIFKHWQLKYPRSDSFSNSNPPIFFKSIFPADCVKNSGICRFDSLCMPGMSLLVASQQHFCLVSVIIFGGGLEQRNSMIIPGLEWGSISLTNKPINNSPFTTCTYKPQPSLRIRVKQY